MAGNFCNCDNCAMVVLKSTPYFLESRGFPGGSDCKEPTYNAGDLGSIPGKISWSRS